METRPFETVINTLLKSHDYADRLRRLSSDNPTIQKEGKLDYVFAEAEFAAHVYDGSYTPEEKADILERFSKLMTAVSKSNKPLNKKDIFLLDLLYKSIEDGKVLSNSVLKYLNILYKKYK